MATTIISCKGEGQPWQLDNENSPDIPTCPVCELTNGDLKIKVTKLKSGKYSPPNLPEHEVEVDGTELRYVLVNGDFDVHSSTCPQPARDIKLGKTDYEKPATLVALNAEDAVTQLWEDQIREADNIEDPDSPTEEELAPYYGATHFHQRCLSKVDGFSNKKASASTQGKRDARRILAALMIEAMAAELEKILGTNLAGPNGEDGDGDDDRREVLKGMSNEEIRKTASAWVHHLPANRERWVASGFPIPDRSEWRDAITTKADQADAA